jgi:MoaA/NifB/PqqE/SkfB family radical SAM enzyme
MIEKLARLRKMFRFEPGYFTMVGNPFLYFLKQGHVCAHIIDRIKFRIFPRLQIVSKYPTHIDIETASSCQMKCPMCYTTYLDNAKKGIMKFGIFKKIIDEAAKESVYSVRLSWRGEPLLNPRIVEMVKYAKNSGIKEVAMLSNAERLDKTMAEKLVDLDLDWISFSMDGSGEVYNSIRAPAKFEETVEKIRYMRHYRDKTGKSKPLIRVQSVLSAIKDDTEGFTKIWEGIADRVNSIADQARDFEIKEMNHDPNYLCPTPWERMTIGHDGKVHQCLSDYDRKHVHGDLETQSIYDVWHGKSFAALRRAFKLRKAVSNLPACQSCSMPVVTEERIIKLGNKKFPARRYKGISDIVENGNSRKPTSTVVAE